MNKLIATLTIIAAVFTTASAHAQTSYTYDDAVQIDAAHHGRNLPEYITLAIFLGDSVTVYSDGSYIFGNLAGTFQSSPVDEEDFNNVLFITGDFTLAMEAGLGLLTPFEMQEIMSRSPNSPVTYNLLSWFWSPYRDYGTFGDDNGGGQNDL